MLYEKIVDITTGEETLRPFTAEETAQYEAKASEISSAVQAASEAEAKREAVLEALAAAAGLGVEEVKEALNV